MILMTPALRRTPALRTVLPIGALLLAAGCTLGPDYQRPTTAADQMTSFVHAGPDAAAPAPEVDPWWRSFGDPLTAELVETALAANTDLEAAAARVLAAEASLRQARSSRWPEANLSAGASRQKNSFVLPGAGRVSPISTTYSDALSVAYQADLFGGLRRSRQAAWAEFLAQDAARQTVLHTVIAEVVRARVRIDTLARSLALAEETRDSWQRTHDTIDRRNRLGLAPTLDVRLARENLAAAEAAAVARAQELAQARLALDVLLGQAPGASPAASIEDGLDPLPDLEPIPVGLPAGLLERRPDLRRAEMQLAAATARIGVAIADLYPGLSLTASAGNSSDSLSDLLSSETLIYSAAANLLAPIFDGGRRRAAVGGARASAEVAAAEYAGAVLVALREVEDALLRERILREQLTFLDQRVEEARAADRSARQRYQRGVTPFLSVLDTERRWRAAEDALLAARASLWNARIDLHLALGGDWLDEPASELQPENPTRLASEDL